MKLPLTYHVKYSFLKLLYASVSADMNPITHIVILSEIIQSANFVWWWKDKKKIFRSLTYGREKPIKDYL